MNDRSVRAEDLLERGNVFALFVDDDELRRRINPKMGRDPTTAVQVRLRAKTFELLENWRRSQSKIPSRSQAVRLFIERGLAETTPGGRVAHVKQAR
jgi:hypothetical protein